MTHYLDNSATTPLCENARAAMLSVMDENFGNPSSLHAIGVKAQEIVDAARKNVLSTFLAAGSAENRNSLFSLPAEPKQTILP